MYNTYKSASEVLLGSILVGTDLNYVVHTGCICRSSAGGRKLRELIKKAVLSIIKELAFGAGMNCLQRSTENYPCLSAIPH